MKDKKASIIDVGFLLVAILGLALFILIVGFVFPQITQKLGDSEIGNNTASMSALNTTNVLMGRFDGLFLTIFIGLAISVLISSFFIESSPILIPIYIIALGLMIIFAVVSENVYEKFINSSTFSTVAETHIITNYIMSHLVMVSIAIGVLSMILIFAKPRGGGQPF